MSLKPASPEAAHRELRAFAERVASECLGDTEGAVYVAESYDALIDEARAVLRSLGYATDETWEESDKEYLRDSAHASPDYWKSRYGNEPQESDA